MAASYINKGFKTSYYGNHLKLNCFINRVVMLLWGKNKTPIQHNASANKNKKAKPDNTIK